MCTVNQSLTCNGSNHVKSFASANKGELIHVTWQVAFAEPAVAFKWHSIVSTGSELGCIFAEPKRSPSIRNIFHTPLEVCLQYFNEFFPRSGFKMHMSKYMVSGYKTFCQGPKIILF